MAFGFVILAGLILVGLGLAGLGYYVIPVGIIGAVVFGAFVANRARNTGPGGGMGADKPQDDAGGPTHVQEDYAHDGQAAMTPEQMQQRTGA